MGAAPDQWYSFKPMWPETEDEARELEARAAAMLAGTTGDPATADPVPSPDRAP